MITKDVMQHNSELELCTTIYYKKRKKIKATQLIYSILSMYGIFLGCVFFVKSVTMYINHDTVSIISPIAVAEEPKVTPTIIPTPTKSNQDKKKDYILSQKHGDILLRIWTNETTRGTNRNDDPTNLQVYCEKKGQTNEFGYDPQHKYCFSDFNYSVQVIDRWWDSCLQSRSLKACLLRYSGNSTYYVEKFLSQSNN